MEGDKKMKQYKPLRNCLKCTDLYQKVPGTYFCGTTKKTVLRNLNKTEHYETMCSIYREAK